MTYRCPTPIAILLAVYNGEKYLKEQVDSIIAQTNCDWTLYIRDDASTDTTREIIAAYCSRYPRIVAVSDELGNLGYNGNFSKLLELVEADYYMFCDADDYWLPEKVQASFDFLREKEQLYPGLPLLAHCDMINADEHLNVNDIRLKQGRRFHPDWISGFNHIPLYITGGSVSIFNQLCKPHFFENNPLDINYDGWLGLQVSRYGKLFYIPLYLKIYRRHGNAATKDCISHQNLPYIVHKLRTPVKTFRYHWEMASKMQTLGYGGKLKYFYYRIVVFVKLKWARVVIKK